MNHKLPLTIDWDDDALHPALRNIQIYDANNVRVAEHVDGEYAAFIVRACNAHDAVVKAVRNLLAYLPEGDDFQSKLEGALLDALELAGTLELAGK